MSLNILTGASGAGKSTALYMKVIHESLSCPEKRYYIIVPEQSTMQTQKEIVNLHPRHGIMNIDVLSFNRLAYRVFSEIGYRREELLEEIGKTFLLEKIALEEGENLSYFGQTLERPEMLGEMKALISELMLYDVSPKDLLQGSDHKEGAFAMKTGDIALVYERFVQKMEGSFMTAEEVPDKLCSVIEESENLKGSVIVLDGFTGFTPVQLRLVERLMTISEDLWVGITLEESDTESRNERDLFGLSYENLRSLKESARRANVPLGEEIHIEGTKGRHCASMELAHLSRHLFRRRRNVWNDEVSSVNVMACENPFEETRTVAEKISQLIRTEGYRYGEIAVITGDMSSYSQHVRRVFSEWKIPYFLDEKRNLITNPFIEFLRAALEVCEESWRSESVLRLLKSSMTDFTSEEIEHLEYYVSGMGINSRKKWHSTFLRHYRGEDPGEVPKLELLRLRLTSLMDPLDEVMGKRSATVLEKSTALYEFCVRSGAEKKLRAYTDGFEAQGRNDLVREYEQAYPYVMNVLDKLVDVLGEEHISKKDYRALLEAAFREARIAVIPPGADRVLIGDLERSRLSEVKVLFFVGVNEGIIPKPPEGGGLLSDADREKLAVHHISLKPTAREAMYTERFYLYLALTKPSEALYVSYSASDSSGRVLRPSYLVDTIKRIFPSLTVVRREEGQREIEREETGIGILTEGIGKLGERNLTPEYLELFAYYLHHPGYSRQVEQLIEAADTRMKTDKIGQEAAKALYGTDLRNSASRLEQFCACEFRHFLQYGLRLKEAPDFTFTGMDRGSIIHRSLELFADQVKKDRIRWADLRDDSARRSHYVKAALQKSVEEEGGDVLFDNARNEYQIERMRHLMDTSAWALAELLAAGDFDVWDVEAGFIAPEELDTMQIPLAEGSRMTLTGKIDRIDTYEEEGRTWIKVLDYKTGSLKFDLNKVYYGIQIQLPVYLNAAMELMKKAGKHPYPAGIFYYNVANPMLEYQEGEGVEERRRRLLKELKGSGMVVREEDILRHMDKALNDSRTSDILPVGYTSKGALTARSKTLSMEQFVTLCQFTSRKVRESAVRMMRGDAKINPYEMKSGTACDFCSYKGICGFDRRIPGYVYRTLLSRKDEEILELMEEEDSADALNTEETKEGE